TRQNFFTSFCCPPNLLRTIAEVGGYAYSKTEDAICLNLYGANTLNTELLGQPLSLVQETRYPWDGTVRIRMEECPSESFALKLRIPGWSQQASLKVNDQSQPINT